MDALEGYISPMLDGYWVTIQIAVASILLAAVVAIALGSLAIGKARSAKYSATITAEFLRGTSVLVQLFWVYYALPLIPGMPRLDPFVAAVVVLGINGGAYGADIVRAGLRSVPKAQNDACHALGLPPRIAFFKVKLPQALSLIVPSFGSVAVDMVKWTSVVSFVAVHDVLYWANIARTDTGQTVAIYLSVAVLYLVLCGIVAFIFRLIEKWLPVTRSRRAPTKSVQPSRIGVGI